MSGAGKGFSRRSVAAGGAIALTLGLGALGITARRWLTYPKTAYDDLLANLVDRDSAQAVGHAVIGTTTFDAKQTASDLRRRLDGRSLLQATADDLSRDRLIEAKGWVLPETLGLLCALAAEPV